MKKWDELPKDISDLLDELGLKTEGKTFDGDTSEVLSVSTSFDVKGNSDKIRRLKEAGWVELRRRKSLPPTHIRCEYVGYTFRVTMELGMRGR